MTRISRRDVEAGRVEPKRIANGAIVPPSLQVNTETFGEHQWRLGREGRRLLSRVAAAALFPPEEVDEWFARESS